MNRVRERRRKRIQFYSKLIQLIIVMIILMLAIGGTLARYSSSGRSETNIDVAFYLLKEQTISKQVILETMEPREEPYIYNFSVANNNGEDRTEVALEYTVEVKVTTNLPLVYKLYVNDSSENLFESHETIQDDNGMYFKRICSSKNNFGYKNNEQNNYRLEIVFPLEYNSIDYQGIAEALEIKIDAKQKM